MLPLVKQEVTMQAASKKRAPRRPSEFPSLKFALANPMFNDRILVIRRAHAVEEPAPPRSPGLPSSNSGRKRKSVTDEKEISSKKRRKGKWSRGDVKALRDKFKQFLHVDEEPETNEYQRLPVCSVVLAAYSSVFRAMLSHQMQETETGVIVAEVDSYLEARALMHMIEFFYGNAPDPNMTIRDKIELFLICNRYDVPILLNRCVDDLKSCMDTELAAFLISMRDRFELSSLCAPLLDSSVNLILQQYHNFDREWPTDRFLRLDYACVYALLDSSRLAVRNENSVFQAIYRWLTKSDECINEHKGHFFVGAHLTKAQSLMSCIRLTELSHAFVVDVVFHHPLFKSLSNCDEIKTALTLSFGYTSSGSARRERYRDLLEPTDHPRRNPIALMFAPVSEPLGGKPKRNKRKTETKEAKDGKEGKEEKKEEKKEDAEKDVLCPHYFPSESSSELWADGYCFIAQKSFQTDNKRDVVVLTLDTGKTGLANEFFVNCCITINESQKHTYLFKQGQCNLQLEVEDMTRDNPSLDISVDRSL